MSQYSEVIGSFLRKGNFPLEADYVFVSEEALKTYYDQPENKAILHKGLLKIVEDDGSGKQALYWVAKESDGTLGFFKLLTGGGIEDIESQLEDLKNKLEQEIQDRKNADEAIWGTNDPTNIPSDLNSILDLANAIEKLQTDFEDVTSKIDTIKKELKATVGTLDDDIITYLATLDFQSLTAISKKLGDFFLRTNPENAGIDTWKELVSFLEGVTDDQTLLGLLKNVLNSIYGDPMPSEPFRTLRGIEDFVREFKAITNHEIGNLHTEINQTQVGVGLDSDGKYSPDQETTYLKGATSVMNALKILDSLIKELMLNKPLEVENHDIVPLDIRRELNRTVIGAKLLLSTSDGNGIIKKNDGAYMGVISEYQDGVLSLKVNGAVVAQHVLGVSSLVEDAYYDSANESIVIIFKLMNGDKNTVRIPVGSLIREWTVDNSNPGKVVELYKVENVGAGSDLLSADVRLYNDRYNILVKEGNTLYVKGTTDNLTHKDSNLETVIESLITKDSELESSISNTNQKLTDEINRAQLAEQDLDNKITNETQRAVTKEDEIIHKLEDERDRAIAAEDALSERVTTNQKEIEKKAPIDSPVFKGNPQVENNPPEGDNSMRIPSTNWVLETIKTGVSDGLTDHLKDFNNPHKVTAEQVGTYTKDEINQKLDEKADGEDFSAHLTDYDNPHKTTADQVGAYTQQQVDDILKLKADLVDGTIPKEQLPPYIQSSVHYAGHWDANSNSPAFLPIDPERNGEYYFVSNPGSWNGMDFKVGDFIVNANGTWLKIQNNSDVSSVNGHKGDVVIRIGDIPDLVDILDRKAEADNVYTIEQINEIITNLVNKHNEEVGEINTKIENVNTEIKNLADNKADLIDGKVPISQLPDSVLGGVKYMGLWNALDNDPQLNNGDPSQDGWYYIVSQAGTRFGVDFDAKDWVINSGGTWTKVDNVDSVVSVNGKKGVVVLEIQDIPGLKDAIDAGGTGLDDHIHDYNNPHRVTKDQVGLGKVENLAPNEYPVSDATKTEINRIDSNVTTVATDLSNHVKDKTNPHQVTKDQVGLGNVDNTSDLAKPISVAQQNEFNRIDRELDKKAAQADLNSHIQDYNNPHKVTKAQVGLDKVDNTSDLEKPISVAVQEAINQIKIDASGYATKEELNDHIRDKNNPHNVTKEQIGLGNVDNTSDMNKPISTATQMALDKKADVHHSHTMADITDLENLPIIKGFVESLAELPEVATGGDKYIMTTQVGSGNTRYTLCEFDGATGTWKQKLLTTGGVAAVIDGEVWEMTSQGLKRMLDADDYKYFYDKIWNETKNLVESIEWDESVTDVIRLKITTKKAYANPNTDEAEVPTVNPTVSYINIEKERFMSSAYSRPATQSDVDNGYASKVGVPVLVIELTTGDEVVIDLTDTMNIYDPVDTSSIDMSVSDWTGDPATSYKISAQLRIAENSDPVKLVDTNNNGVYARLDIGNTNSVELVNDTATNNGTLRANLIIDNALNNNSDVQLAIGANGVSAKIVWGDYD